MFAQNFGRYRILRELGRGGKAIAYQARDPVSGRQVALKLLSDELTAAPGFGARFQRQTAALQAFSHPFAVPLVDFGREEEQFFVVMRHMPGGTLAERLDARPMLLSAVTPILQRIAEALDAAHAAGIVHGDLRPAHVLFDLSERSFLADLGLVSMLYAPEHGAGWDRLVSPAYISPEQVAGQDIDPRTDVYALGVMLFEMITGRLPFVGQTPDDLRQQHAADPPPHLGPDVLGHFVLPPDFNPVIARALAKNPDERFPTAGALFDSLRALFLDAPGTIADVPPVAAVAAAHPPADPPPAPELLEPDSPKTDAPGEAFAALPDDFDSVLPEEPSAPDEPAPVSGDAPPPQPPDEPASSVEESEPTPSAPVVLAAAAAIGAPAAPSQVDVPDSADIMPFAVEEADDGGGSGLKRVLIGGGLILLVALLAFGPWLNSQGWFVLQTPTATATLTPTATDDSTMTPLPAPFTFTPLPPSATPSPSPTSTTEPSATSIAQHPVGTPSPTRTRTRTPTASATVTATATTRPPTLPAFTATPAATAVPPPSDTPAPPPTDAPPPPPPPEPTSTPDSLIGSPPAPP